MLSNGLEISNITSESGNAAAIVDAPVHEDDPGLVVNTTPGIANVIEGDLLTLSDSTDQTKQAKGKLTASFAWPGIQLTGSHLHSNGMQSPYQGTDQSCLQEQGQMDRHKEQHLDIFEHGEGVLSVDINLTDGAQDGTTQVDVQAVKAPSMWH